MRLMESYRRRSRKQSERRVEAQAKRLRKLLIRERYCAGRLLDEYEEAHEDEDDPQEKATGYRALAAGYYALGRAIESVDDILREPR